MRKPNFDELEIIRRNAPDVFEMVKQAKKQKIGMVIFMIDAFGGEYELLHNVVWYITSQGLQVVITGEKK